MAAVSFPVSRPKGRALVIGSPQGRSTSITILQRFGFQCHEVDDPYAAMAEVCRRPLVYHALILSLNVAYPEELAIIQSIKSRFQHLDIWLTDIDGRQASLAEAMRLGADGLLSDEGLHRTAGPDEPPPHPPTITSISPPPRATKNEAPPEPSPAAEPEPSAGEPILTADELRALLQEQPSPRDSQE